MNFCIVSCKITVLAVCLSFSMQDNISQGIKTQGNPTFLDQFTFPWLLLLLLQSLFSNIWLLKAHQEFRFFLVSELIVQLMEVRNLWVHLHWLSKLEIYDWSSASDSIHHLDNHSSSVWLLPHALILDYQMVGYWDIGLVSKQANCLLPLSKSN